MRLCIRDEAPCDHEAMRRLLIAAFGGLLEADLVDRLRADGAARISLVAHEAGTLVGQVLFSPMRAPFRALALAPVSVHPARQRMGIGTTLVRAGLARTAEEGWEGVFVVGDPAFYRRFGFTAELARGFRSPYAGPHVMAMSPAGALPATTGSIEYAAAFADLG